MWSKLIGGGVREVQELYGPEEMKTLNEKQKAKLAILHRKQKVLIDNKESILKTLNPVLEDLEEIRIAIDEIELENKYGK